MIDPSSDLSYMMRIAVLSPVLQRDHEMDLVRRFQRSGDRRAEDALVRANLRMVISLAQKYRYYGVPASDLVAEGNYGLVTALRKFDPDRGTRLGTYARYWIRSYMFDYIIRSLNLAGGMSGLVRRRYFFRLRRERARIAAVLGAGAAMNEELARRMNLGVDEVQLLLERLDCRCVSLDDPARRDSRGRPLDDLVADDNPEETYFRGTQARVASSALNLASRELDVRERFIVESRLLPRDNEERTLTEIGKAWGVSRERVRQLEGRAKRKLGGSPQICRNISLREWFTD